MKLIDYRRSQTANTLRELMRRYTTDNLVGISPKKFQNLIEKHKDDWGHDHNFGTFQMHGKMQDRHLFVMATMIDVFGLDVRNKSVADIGCWSGGFSLLMHALGATEIHLIEKKTNRKKMATTILKSFDISVSDIKEFCCDVIISSGVLYHCKSIFHHLEYCRDFLKSNGVLFLETAAIKSNQSILEYRGPTVIDDTWFVPSVPALKQMCRDVGFTVDKAVFYDGGRAIIRCGK